ncbi:hypothetical protein BEWA_018400 [Theileria equi strain WA]|uniref:Uncharacterized protein n=1 Tax=Theileria equi strain WA TaxID=1537102 RepID=L0ATX6_THEEQ|nr:hypothetical protein BEWA_018400 [Theileria equi strain WA]AFZ78995.1 hypothetical protein BEWA_018400 [Theileria equi strain WA]|eukprot:XP_004828661.1 hypothetical protein BEWA_018400 [Theileria equi strain WA]
MRNLFHVFTFIIVKITISYSYTTENRKIFASVSLDSNDLSSSLPFVSFNGSKLYFAYYNTIIDESYGKESSYRLLDNIASGLSVFTHPTPNFGEYEKDTIDKHLLSSSGGWCYILTLFIFYPKLRVDLTDQNHLFNELYNRCMILNGSFSDHNFREYSSSILFSSNVTLDDLYIFEKFSRMCPKPLYLSTRDIEHCSKHTSNNDKSIIADFFLHRECYMNDIMDLNLIPYGKLYKDSTKSIKSLIDPLAVLDLYLDKWSYVYMPKQMELELSMDKLSLLLLMKLLSNSTTQKLISIRKFLYSTDIINMRVNSITGGISLNYDSGSTNINKSDTELVFGLSFDLKGNTEMLKNFHVPINGKDMNQLYKTLRTSHEKEYVYDLNYQDISGQGQHRWITISISLDRELLGLYSPKHGKYYIKLVHMLDHSIYLDNDELDTMYTRVEDEKDIFILEPSYASINEDRSADINLKVLKTPFINIEEPEINSSPIIYNAYAILEESLLTYSPLRISYKLPIHSRYMNMNKSLTKEIMKIDKLGLLDGKKQLKHGLSLTSEPKLYIYTENMPESEVLEKYAEEYLIFLRSISFATFVSNNSNRSKSNGIWQRLYFGSSNDINKPIDLCKGERTGIAYVSRKFSTESCNPIIHEMRRNVIDSECYLAFSVPIGAQDDIKLINNVTVGIITLSCLLSLFFVCDYLRDVAYKPNPRKQF